MELSQVQILPQVPFDSQVVVGADTVPGTHACRVVLREPETFLFRGFLRSPRNVFGFLFASPDLDPKRGGQVVEFARFQGAGNELRHPAPELHRAPFFRRKVVGKGAVVRAVHAEGALGRAASAFGEGDVGVDAVQGQPHE